MLIVADVHGATVELRRLAASTEPLLILGDLINFIDYRTNDGIVAELCGPALVAEMVALRTAGDYRGAGSLWRNFSRGREAELRTGFDRLVAAAYVDICSALQGATGYVTFGNVDQPEVLRRHLPGGMTFVDHGVVEIDGVTVGIAGGGISSPLGTAGEVDDVEMEAKLDALGPVEVLGTHVPPAVAPLAQDVIGGRDKGSPAVLRYLERHRPRYHYFGDIHQPQAVSWRVGTTLCRNVGYFRATGKAVRHG